MRIIAGTLKGRHLNTLKGQTIRPTSDKVKGAIFNVLNTRVREARVLDLFAGTGSLALEALSRGAASALLVDAGRRSAQLIRDNITHLGVAGQAVVVHEDARRFLHRYAGEAFDLVFLDPPYHHGLPQIILPELSGKVSPPGVIVAETAKDEIFPADPFEIRIVREYGGSKVWFLQHPDTNV